MEKEKNAVTIASIQTPLGHMTAVADEQALFFLAFSDGQGLQRALDRLQKKTRTILVPRKNLPIYSLENEINEYFNGTLTEFKTPIYFEGSPFQMYVWKELRRIAFGQTQPYSHIAKAIGRPSAFRAVARANATNQLALIIPCHRVINANGSIGGYAGTVERKRWLLDHERQFLSFQEG